MRPKAAKADPVVRPPTTSRAAAATAGNRACSFPQSVQREPPAQMAPLFTENSPRPGPLVSQAVMVERAALASRVESVAPARGAARVRTLRRRQGPDIAAAAAGPVGREVPGEQVV